MLIHMLLSLELHLTFLHATFHSSRLQTERKLLF